MKRIAILIGTSVSQYGALGGVEPDLTRYAAFLKSPYGGAWTDGEIIPLLNPSQRTVQLTMAAYKDVGYSFITFSGHGEHDMDQGTSVAVTNDYEPSVSELRTGAPRQLLIVDVCRTLTVSLKDDTRLEGIEKVASFAPTYAQSCRNLYDKCISGAEEGRSILYSCSINQSAGESTQGGYFSSALVRQAIGWAQAAGRPQAATMPLDVPGAFEPTRQFVSTNHFPQRPVMENGRRRFSFPFAVR
jgi:Caspase domain